MATSGPQQRLSSSLSLPPPSLSLCRSLSCSLRRRVKCYINLEAAWINGVSLQRVDCPTSAVAAALHRKHFTPAVVCSSVERCLQLPLQAIVDARATLANGLHLLSDGLSLGQCIQHWRPFTNFMASWLPLGWRVVVQDILCYTVNEVLLWPHGTWNCDLFHFMMRPLV